MGMGAFVAGRATEGFTGVHRDSEGFPEETGRRLWGDYHGRFQRDVVALLGHLLATEPIRRRTGYGGEYTYELDDLGMTITDGRTAFLDGWGYRTRVAWAAPEPRWDRLRWTSAQGVWSAEMVAEAARRVRGA